MSLAELAVAMGLLLVLVSSLFSAFRPADGLFATQTEAADMQQRLRAALDALRRDLSAAGSGGSAGRDGGPMTFTAPAVLPRRIGLRGSDAPDVFRADAITVFQASPLPAVDTRIAQSMTASSDVTRVLPAPGCPPLDPQCGIDVDDDVLVADDGGAFDLFTVTAVTSPMLTLRHNTPDWGKVYPAGSIISRVMARTYFLRVQRRRVHRSWPVTTAVPVPTRPLRSRGRARLRVSGRPAPPQMRRPLSDPTGPWTTYGSRPEAADTSVTPFLAGSAACSSQRNAARRAAIPFLAPASCRSCH